MPRGGVVRDESRRLFPRRGGFFKPRAVLEGIPQVEIRRRIVGPVPQRLPVGDGDVAPLEGILIPIDLARPGAALGYLFSATFGAAVQHG